MHEGFVFHHSHHRHACLLLTAIVCGSVAASIARAQDAKPVDFVKDVQPLIAAKCHACHSVKKQESDLRLDRKADALRGGGGGKVIIPGNPEDSALIDRIESDDATFQMPPPRKGDPLSAAEIQTLKDWIRQGAPWPETADAAATHWAFRAPVRPAIPKVGNARWTRNPIDHFILARLESESIAPSPETDPATLIRRLYLDLIGLPPTPEQISAAVNDLSPGAIDRVVECLLASPHYGERWGRHWLDAARYADSDGFEKDKPRHIWFYRDWVIDAFNRNLPYDRFVFEQIAGDLLPNRTQDQHVATGFLRNSMVNEEGGIDPEQFRMEAMFDRMDAIGKAVLGLTIQCAQCHSHKYDPITQEEYYRLFAFLNNDDEPARVAYSPSESMRIAEIRRQTLELERSLREMAPDWPERVNRWADEIANRSLPKWTTLQAPFEEISTGGQKYLLQSDGSFLAAGYAPTKHTGVVSIETDLRGIRALKLELLNDANLPAYGPGRSYKGTCALTEFAVEAAPKSDPSKKQKVKIQSATADYDQPERPLEPNFEDRSNRKRITGPVRFAIDDNDETAWGIDAGPGRRNVPREAVFVLEQPIDFDGGATITIRLTQNHGGWNSDDLMTNNLGRFRISATDAENALADPLPARIRAIAAIPPANRTEPQIAALFSAWRETQEQFNNVNSQIASLWQAHPEGATTLVLESSPAGRVTNVLRRGDFLSPIKPTTPGTPAILHPLANETQPNRLALAEWLVDRKSPTTARVFVNRVWQSYFGFGLVATPEDFGTQGERPSHPELLDWLATEFMEQDWNIKALHRLITSSAAYRQSSQFRSDLLARDPTNRLLARGARLRVEGEIVRDIQLAASGLLVSTIGGKAVMPPAPAFLFQPPASYAPFPWIEETGPNRFRRGLYTWRRRSTPYPMLAIFDVPPGETACVRRARSNTPLQALTLLNEPMALEASRALARRMFEITPATDSERLARGFTICTGRPPTDRELEVLRRHLDAQTARLAEGWLNPWEIASGNAASRPESIPPGTTPTRLAAFTLTARVLLNLDETFTKE
jgi:hypothetical protein